MFPVSIKDKDTNKQIDRQTNKQTIRWTGKKRKKIGINYFLFLYVDTPRRWHVLALTQNSIISFFFNLLFSKNLLNGGIKVKDYFQFKDV